MHICVCVKQTPDSASVYVDPISGQVDTERFVQVLNPADACAVEAAVRLKERLGGSVLVVSLGSKEAEGALRAALALGADQAQLLRHPAASELNPFAIAALLAAYLQREASKSDLILCGSASSDWASGSVGAALAEFLSLPQVTGVAQIQLVEHVPPLLHVTRKLEHGYRELLEAELPLLLTVSADLNEPRYPSLPAHLAALKASIPTTDARTLYSQRWPSELAETTLLELSLPRPLPRRIAAPDSQHSAFRRIGEIVEGGATGRQTRLVEGQPEELARELVAFLRARGFV